MHSPATYSKYNSNPVKHTQHLLSKYKDFFKWSDSEDILEVGCANGVVTRQVLYPFVKKHVNKLIGTDISQEAIDVANKLHSAPQVSFRRMDIEEDNLGKKYEGQFSHIFTFSVLDLLKTPDVWSRNLYEMLKPNGQLFASVVVLPHPYPTVTTAQRKEKTAPWAKYMEKCSDIYVDYGPNPIETLSEILKKVGFSIDMVDIDISNTTFESDENLDKTMLSLNGFLKCIPEEMQDEYIKDFLGKMREVMCRNEDGSSYFVRTVVVLIATKV